MISYIRATLKRKFLAGLVVSIPAVVTVLVIIWFFLFVDGLLGPMLTNILGYKIPGLGFISAIILIFLIGIVSTNVFGKKALELFDFMLARIPVVKGVYTAIKQLVDGFAPGEKSSFKKFVVVEYPRPGTFAFGFLTKDNTVKADNRGNEISLRAVYIPTNNLYLGDIVLFNEKDVFNTDISIEEGIKIILSGGISTPARIKEAKE